jgi:NADH:ubiquinone oxidoreductase subunit 3 (subunit A)
MFPLYIFFCYIFVIPVFVGNARNSIMYHRNRQHHISIPYKCGILNISYDTINFVNEFLYIELFTTDGYVTKTTS